MSRTHDVTALFKWPFIETTPRRVETILLEQVAFLPRGSLNVIISLSVISIGRRVGVCVNCVKISKSIISKHRSCSHRRFKRDIEALFHSLSPFLSLPSTKKMISPRRKEKQHHYPRKRNHPRFLEFSTSQTRDIVLRMLGRAPPL